MFLLYTKTFGGKIWQNLHSVSPGNFFGKKFKMASLVIFRQKLCKHHLVQKNWKVKGQILCSLKNSEKNF